MKTVCFQGLETTPIDTQVQIIPGLPAVILVGLPDKAVTESRERVRAALYALGIALPPKRIIMNLSPADIQKEGSHYDLPIALALLATLDVIPKDVLERYLALGELSLSGSLIHITGVLSAALFASSLNLGLICPSSSGPEAAWAGDLEILAPDNLLALVNHFKGTQVLRPPTPHLAPPSPHSLDLGDIRGQEGAKRALEIAAAGGHHLRLIGPPGAGKSMLASRLPGILPPLSPSEALSVTMIHSLSGFLKSGHLLTSRPFRDPHHSASMAAIVGGGIRALPGEISLAHNGVLFLDETPEFSPHVLEALRGPLESGTVVIARANAHLRYPARFQLICAMNPCRCGFFDDLTRGCTRRPLCGQTYQSRLSGPFLDRIDLHVWVEAVPVHEMAASTREPSESPQVGSRVQQARDQQRDRFERMSPGCGLLTNHQADGAILKQICPLSDPAYALLQKTVEVLKLSARGYHRVLRVSRTLADLDGSESLERQHVAEALSYRPEKTNP